MAGKNKNSIKRRKSQLLRRHIEITLIIIAICVFLFSRMVSDKEDLRDRGISEYNNGQYQEALESFRKAYDEDQWFTDEMDADILMYTGDSYMKLNMYQEAYDTYVKILEDYAEYADTDKVNELINLSQALIFVQSGSYEEALPGLTAAVENGYTEMNMYLGACHEKLGDYESMMSCYNAYLASNSINTYIAYQLSSYYMDTDINLSSAKSYIDQGLSCNDTVYLEEVKLNEIIYYEKISDYNTAFLKAQEFISEYPDNSVGQAEYDFLYTRVNIDPTPVHIEPEEENDNDSETSVDSSGS